MKHLIEIFQGYVVKLLGYAGSCMLAQSFSISTNWACNNFGIFPKTHNSKPDSLYKQNSLIKIIFLYIKKV